MKVQSGIPDFIDIPDVHFSDIWIPEFVWDRLTLQTRTAKMVTPVNRFKMSSTIRTWPEWPIWQEWKVGHFLGEILLSSFAEWIKGYLISSLVGVWMVNCCWNQLWGPSQTWCRYFFYYFLCKSDLVEVWALEIYRRRLLLTCPQWGNFW